jgi:GT2 family glycosyltransferase
MGNAVKVAVVVVNYNAGNHLEKCLSNLMEQTYTPEKIIVVDNASSDCSAVGIKEKFSEIDWVLLDEYIGFAAANNLAVGKVEDCQWVAFLNPDAFASA